MSELSEKFNLENQLLLVDDVPSVRRIVSKFLIEAGITNIVTADNGLEALEKLKTEKISLIISDWNMPSMNGLDFLKSLRDSGSKIPFIMITATSEKDAVLKVLNSGVTDYIAKPFNKEILEQKILNAINKHTKNNQ